MAEGFLESIGTAELVKLKYDEGYNAGYSSGYSRGYSAGQSAASGSVSQYNMAASGWSQCSFTAVGNDVVDKQTLWYQELSVSSSARAVIVCAIKNMDYTLTYGSSNFSINAAAQGIDGLANNAQGLHQWPGIWSSTNRNPPSTIDRNFHPKLSKGEAIMLTFSKSTTSSGRDYYQGGGFIVIEFSSSSRIRCFLTISRPVNGDISSELKTYLSNMRLYAI